MPERLPQFSRENAQSGDVPPSLFGGGWVSISPKALTTLAIAGEDFRALLERHLIGDWGDLRQDEKMLNDLAVEHGEAILSAYTLSTGAEIWITTTADRENTIIELPEEAQVRREENAK